MTNSTVNSLLANHYNNPLLTPSSGRVSRVYGIGGWIIIHPPISRSREARNRLGILPAIFLFFFLNAQKDDEYILTNQAKASPVFFRTRAPLPGVSAVH